MENYNAANIGKKRNTRKRWTLNENRWFDNTKA